MLLASVTCHGSRWSSVSAPHPQYTSLRSTSLCEGREGGLAFATSVITPQQTQKGIARKGHARVRGVRSVKSGLYGSHKTPACLPKTDLALKDNLKSPPPENPAALAPSPKLDKVEWKDTWLDRLLQRILEERILRALELDPRSARSARSTLDALRPGAHGGDRDEYDAFVRAALLLARRPPEDTRQRTLSLLYDLFPSWFMPAFKTFLSWWPMWFDARHAAASSVPLNPKP